MFCPTCGFSLDDGETVCPVCGTRIELNQPTDYGEAPSESENSDSRADSAAREKRQASSSAAKNRNQAYERQADPRQSSSDRPEEGGKRKRGRTVGIIILVCVLIAACLVLVYFLTSEDGFSNLFSRNDTALSAEEELSAEEIASEEEEEAAVVSAGQNAGTNIAPDSSFIGYWNISGSEEEELTISNVTDSTVTFTLWSYGAYSLNDAIAYINDQNMAYFSYSLDGMTMSGTLTFYTDYIVVDITRSDVSESYTGIMVFGEKHSSPWYIEGGEEFVPYSESENSLTAYDSEYILPDSSTRLLTYADIQSLSKEELRLARNEIYARHGRRFSDPELQEYFDSKPWYSGTIEPEDFDSGVLSSIESANISFIESYE